MPDFTGQSTGRYHILESLGQGGMAVVYKAYDTSLDIDVAIKFIRTERLSPEVAEKSLKRFKIEAQKTAKLMHPNIIPVTDYGDFNGVPFLVMRYIEGGKTLKSMLGKQIPWQEAVRTILPIAEALDYAHKNNIVHRDVKPANILITNDGIPMLSDFGIAKIIEEEETMDGLTAAGMAIGTPEYMAPEQWEGKKVDGRADIYALGVVLYEMITGRPPFKADTIPATMVQVLRDPLPRPKQFVRDLPDRIESIIIKALAKEPINRYEGMNDFVRSFDKNTTIKELGNSKRKNSLKFVLFGIFILLVAAVVVFVKLNQPKNATQTEISVSPDSTEQDGTNQTIKSSEIEKYSSLQVYDDFNNPAFDGLYNTSIWSFSSSFETHAEQNNGQFVIQSESTNPAVGGLDLVTSPVQKPTTMNAIGAKLTIKEMFGNGFRLLLKINPKDIDYWHYMCWIEDFSGDISFHCQVVDFTKDRTDPIYQSSHIPMKENTTYNVAICVDPETMTFRGFLNGELFDVYVPENPDYLRNLDFQYVIGVYLDPNTSGQATVDDVYVGEPIE